MTKNRINKAIKHLGLEIVGNGDGYFYFCDLKEGHQVGESIMVFYMNHLTLEQWVKEAELVRNTFKELLNTSKGFAKRNY